ncbi:hypothetical protein MMC07_010001 [Pseudocyphellaria aurata]|nr:hypothetical protein [Pseudocyphellaria aurata]
MALSKPTLVIVPGAFHSPSHYGELIARLHQSEWPTLCLALPSLNPSDPHQADVAGDSAFIRERMLLPLLEAGKDILLVMHSYGGIPGSCAATGLSKSERASQGHEAGIVGIVYIAAILSGECEHLFANKERIPNPWFVEDVEAGLGTVLEPRAVFFADVPEPLASKSCADLLPHALKAFRSPISTPAWAGSEFAGRRVYLRCSQDAATPPVVQNKWLQDTEVEWEIIDFDTSHSPFLSRPSELAICLQGLAERLGMVAV